MKKSHKFDHSTGRMEALLRDLTSADTMSRLAVLERVVQLLENPNWLRDVPVDAKTKLMSYCVNFVKDANPKIAAVALTSISMLVKHHREDFHPLVNMSFDALLLKLGDAKASARETALDVTIQVADILGVASTFERIMMNINTKNQRLKESLLMIIQRLQQKYDSAVKDTVSAIIMCSTLAVALNDPQNAMRQMAVSTLAGLYPIYGEELVDALGQCEVRPAQQKLLLEAIYAQRLKHGTAASAPHSARPPVPPTSRPAAARAPLPDEIDPWSMLDDSSIASSASGASKPKALAATTATAMTAALTSNGVATTKPSLSRRSVSATPRRPLADTAPSTTTAVNLGATTASTVSASAQQQPMLSAGSEGAGSTANAFDPAGFMPFIHLKEGTQAMEIVSEADLRKIMARVATDLAKKNDWEARTNALVVLQKLAWGNLAEYGKCSVELLKGMHELVSAQVIDLRSTVSKEACRAVAALAYCLGQAFLPLAELWWPHLARVAVVKIQVIASAADKAMRVLVVSCMDAKLLGLVAESCTGKNPPLRKLALEYLALAAVCCKVELLERHFAVLKQVLRVTLSDADAGARKAARTAYWVLHHCPSLQAQVRAVGSDLDAAVVRHLHAESGSDNADLSTLLSIVQRGPSAVKSFAHPSVAEDRPSVGPVATENEVTSPIAAVAPVTSSSPAFSQSAAPHPSVAQAIDADAPISELDGLDDEMPAMGTGPRASTAPLATVSKAARRTSLSAGPVRLTAAPSKTGADVADAVSEAPKSSFASTMPINGSRRLSVASASRTLPRPDLDTAELAPPTASKAPAAVLETAPASVGHTTVASLLAQKPSRAQELATPAPKTATRPTIIPAEVPAESVAGPPTLPVVPSTAILNRRASAAFGSGGSGPSQGPAPAGQSTTTSLLSGLADGPKRIIRQSAPQPAEAPAKTTAEPSPAAHENSSEAVAATEVPSTAPAPAPVFVFSSEALRAMLADSQWSERVKALEAMQQRLRRAVDAAEVVEDVMVESFVDLTLPLLGDAHQKVACDAMEVVKCLLNSFCGQLKSRVGAVALAMFHRLADRRQPVREAANSALNLVRIKIEAVEIMSALSPRMAEVPDRMKTALLQFMSAVAPHCEAYFSHAAHTKAFLIRMAHITGGGGVKPSATLTAAASRLLELVYRTSPSVVGGQIAALPLQQQLLLKKYLEGSVPDIDSQIMAASREEWASKSTHPGRASQPIPAPTVSEDDVSAAVSSAFEILASKSTATFESSQASFSFETASEVAVHPLLASPPPCAEVPAAEVEAASDCKLRTPPVASPAARLSSKQKLFRPKTPTTAPATPAALAPATANPFSPPPPPPEGSPPPMEQEAAVGALIKPREMSPVAMDLEVRVLEYMESCRHSASPSENVSPNSPGYAAKHSPATQPNSTAKTPIVTAQVAATSPFLAVRTAEDEEVFNAVLATKRAIDLATEEILQRFSPEKTKKQSLPGSPVAAAATSSTDPLHAALMQAYGLSPKGAASQNAGLSTTPAKPSRLPQRSRPTSAAKEKSTTDTAATEVSIPVVSSSQKLPSARSTPAKDAPVAHASPLATVAAYVAPSNGSAVPHRSPSASTPGAVRDTKWLLDHLKPSVSLAERAEAGKELKRRIKSADDTYWLQNCAQVVMVLLESLRVPPSAAVGAAELVGYEHQELSAKSLLTIARYRCNHLKNLMEVVAERLCFAASALPQPLVQSFEVILSEFAKYDAPRLVRSLMPYATFSADHSVTSTATGENPQVRLLALRVICNSVRFFASAQLLEMLPVLVPVVLSSINSPLPDLRKAVVFILVELYLSVGDSVFPYIESLSPPQRKLMNIYVEKRMKERMNIVATALSH